MENNLTYGDVATKVGISKEYYWMIENGERDGYTYNTAKKIASVFDKNPDDIFLC
ncbi:XRE family transcriptional regulator [Listeria monocytogenes]|nr:XRE family transcriptional regulator [Listeria monocytogenes]HAK1224226.1 helix-turn-helix transcriptional regulator [Listeria monocytogenes]